MLFFLITNLYKILFFNTMMIGIFISISAYSWFSMWLGLEINLLSIIPLLKSNFNIYPTEASLKYFITQTLASIVILYSIIFSFNFNYLNIESMILLNSALMTKLGAAPFHFWFPEITEGLNWMNNLILMTLQKIAPMILLMYNLNMSKFLFFIIVCSSIIGSIYGLNQTSLRKIMTYSSINHLAWMLASTLENKMIWLNYFFIYTLILVNIIYLFNYFNLYYIYQLTLILNFNKIYKFIFSLNFFSLGGLPPFLGFLPKWLTLNFLMKNNWYLISLILVIFTLITLYFYIRLMFTSLTFNMNETFIEIKPKHPNYLMIFFNSMTLMSLMICPMFFNFN